MNKLQMLLNKKKILFIITVITVIGIAIGGFLFSLARRPEAQVLVKKVSRLISLPEGELPTIATVSDYQKLKDQSFFEKSQNGDKVLIYMNARKAYLYRPSSNKLVDVTIINIDSDAKLQEVKMVLRNGTASVGLTNKLEPEIKKILPSSTVIKKENAARSDHQTTIVVALNEHGKLAASVVADYLKATVADLPSDESKPTNADILVIIGEDRVNPSNH